MKNPQVFNYIQNSRYLERLPNFKEKKTQAFTTLGFTLIAFSFFGFFSISPTLSTIAQLQKQLKDSQFVNEQLKQKIVNLRTLQSKYASITSDIPLVLSAIPPSPSVPLFVAQVQALGTKDQVTINRIQTYKVELARNKNNLTPSIQEPQNSYASFDFSIDVSASQTNMSNFLTSLTHFQRIVTIDTFTITKDPNGIVRLLLKGNAYFKH